MRMRSYHHYYYDSLPKAWLPGGHRVYHKRHCRKAEIDDRGPGVIGLRVLYNLSGSNNYFAIIRFKSVTATAEGTKVVQSPTR
jgi:hypothetical protein